MSTKTLVARSHHHAHDLSDFGKWLHKYQRVFDVIGICLVAVSGISVISQLLYPSDMALPLAKIGGLDIGGKSVVLITEQLNEYAQKGQVTIASPSKQWQANWQEIGLAVDAEASAEAAIRYEWWERLIPFSSFIHIAQSQEQPLVALVDNDQLDVFARQLVSEDKQAAQNAIIRIKEGKVIVDPAKNGYVFKADGVRQQVQALAMSEGATLHLIPETVPYARPAEQLSQLKTEAEAMLTHQVTLQNGKKQWQPSPTTVGGWLTFSEDDPKKHSMKLTVNHKAITSYLTKIDKEEGWAPGASTVTLLDGQEIARTPAEGGKTLASNASIAAIEAALKGKQLAPTVELELADVGPHISYVRTYSQTDAGLQAVIEAWKADYPGNNAIIVRELEGKRRYAAIEPDKVFVPASTFKIWVFYAIAQKITSGEISYTTRTDMGWTVNACLEEMIVRSTNPCAISFMNMLGWQATEDIVHAAGFPNTYMNNHGGGDKTTTTRDETNYMLRLYHGTLMAEEPTNRLLGYMKRQIWRTGVPAGVPRGTVVANKVGRYNGWVHDIAIVYGPKSDYILGVMSRGQSWGIFSDLSRRVYGFFQN